MSLDDLGVIGVAWCDWQFYQLDINYSLFRDWQVNLDDLKPAWEALEEMVKDEKILTLGIADLNKDQLEELYNWAQVSDTW